MGLNIKSPAAEGLIRELALKRGVSLTEAVTQAVSEALEREVSVRERQLAEYRARIAEIQAAVAKAPVLDPRPWQEIRDEMSEEGLR